MSRSPRDHAACTHITRRPHRPLRTRPDPNRWTCPQTAARMGRRESLGPVRPPKVSQRTKGDASSRACAKRLKRLESI